MKRTFLSVLIAPLLLCADSECSLEKDPQMPLVASGQDSNRRTGSTAAKRPKEGVRNKKRPQVICEDEGDHKDRDKGDHSKDRDDHEHHRDRDDDDHDRDRDDHDHHRDRDDDDHKGSSKYKNSKHKTSQYKTSREARAQKMRERKVQVPRMSR